LPLPHFFHCFPLFTMPIRCPISRLRFCTPNC